MNNKKMKIVAISTITGFSLLGVGLGIGIGFSVEPFTKHSQKITNSLHVSNFIENIGNDDFITYSDFNKSINWVGDDDNYSKWTVNEAYINNWFEFEIPSKVKFYADKNGIDVFMKNYNDSSINDDLNVYPSYYNSSSPEFRIWFGKGEGDNRVEDFIVINGAGFYGFKKTQEEKDVQNVINLFRNSISLKKEFYVDENLTDKTIKEGVFAKTIKSSDIISNLDEKQLNGVDWKVTNVSQDPKIPSKLVIDIDFSKGKLNENYFSQTFQRFEINDFPIEMGIDDYQSKVKNFIKDENNTIGLGEAFEYTKPESWPDDKVGTVLENYENNAFKFNLPFSYKNRATNAGVEYVFKPWVKDGTENSVFPDEENSEIPKFKIFIRSGSGTPFEYEEFFIVRGNGQVTNTPFEKTENNVFIDELKKLSNSGSENPLTNETIILELINEFASFNENRGNISAEIIANAENSLDNIALTFNPPNNAEIDLSSVKVEAKKISSKESKINLIIEVYVGKEFQDKGSFEIIINYDGFKSQHNYDSDLINAFKEAMQANNYSDVVIKNKLPIEDDADKIEALKKMINQGNGAFYFYEDVFVGYDLVMNDFKWSNKPIFKIDFGSTKIDGNNIVFRIKINAGSASGTFDLTKTIDSFFVTP